MTELRTVGEPASLIWLPALPSARVCSTLMVASLFAYSRSRPSCVLWWNQELMNVQSPPVLGVPSPSPYPPSSCPQHPYTFFSGQVSAQPLKANSTVSNSMLPEFDEPAGWFRSPSQPAQGFAITLTRRRVQLLRRP